MEEHQVVITTIRREGKKDAFRASCTCGWIGFPHKHMNKVLSDKKKHERLNNES